MMRKILAAALLLGTTAGAAQAMPVAGLGGAANGDVIAVAGGCGKGWHRGPYGGCLKTYATPAAHACPRGYHIGPNGGCKGNGRRTLAGRPPCKTVCVERASSPHDYGCRNPSRAAKLAPVPRGTRGRGFLR